MSKIGKNLNRIELHPDAEPIYSGKRQSSRAGRRMEEYDEDETTEKVERIARRRDDARAIVVKLPIIYDTMRLVRDIAELTSINEIQNAVNNQIRGGVNGLQVVAVNAILSRIKEISPEKETIISNPDQKFIDQLFSRQLKILKYPDAKDETPQSISIILNALWRCKEPNIRKSMVQALTLQLKKIDIPFAPDDIAMCLHGLHNEDPATTEEAFKILTTKLIECKEPFTVREIAMSFYGLHGQDPIVCKNATLKLTEKLEQCQDSFNAHSIAMCFYGLYGQSHAVFRNVIEELTKKLEQCEDTFKPQHIAMCFHGLHRQDPIVCKNAILKLTEKLEECQEPFMPLAIAMCFYGLHGQKPSICNNAIQELTKKLKQCEEHFNGKSIAMCFYGLHGHDSIICKDAIQLLTEKIKTQQSTLLSPEITMILQGARSHLNSLGNPAEFLTLLQSHITQDTDFNIRDHDVDIFLRSLCLFNHQYFKVHRQNINGFDNFKDSLNQHRDLISATQYDTTNEEAQVLGILRDLYRKNRLESSAIIDGIKLDIYEPDHRVNIEVDGSSHAFSAEDPERDEYLQDIHGITTVRIPNYTPLAKIQASLDPYLSTT